jgi:8-oxo-dGTP pyrophosphatase MutT (NUDIX family)
MGPGAVRRAGEVCVPLYIWESPEFQSWYSNLQAAGNRLDGAKVLHSFFVRGGHLLAYTLQANVWVSAENRSKSNEFVFTRKDISSVVAYHEGADGIELAFVKEFRTCVNNAAGVVVELPSGSTFKADRTPLQVAMSELNEELGICVQDEERFRHVSTRQLVATLSAHRVHLYALRLTDEEWEQVQQHAQDGTVLGLAHEGERTQVVTAQLSDVFSLPLDASTLGMVFEALRLNALAGRATAAA